MLASVLSLAGIGLGAAVALGLAAKKFAVEVDPRELAIVEALPGANCGACGFPGCAGYAKALVAGTVELNQCPPGGAETVAVLARILGVEATVREAEIAVVGCQGGRDQAGDRYRYIGLDDCSAAQKIAGGPKLCPAGCLGLGSCVRACPFGAIEVTAQGLAVISRELCTGCRKCVAVCPRQLIRMTPARVTVHVLCSSHDKGALVRKYCKVGCIACHICQKTVPEAYGVENFLAVLDYNAAERADEAVAKCPTHCLRDFTEGYPDGSSFRRRSERPAA
ncbi:MAG: RnfABCDGE type electron transport complex subunit B [Desulfuromonadales bacterium]|nr:RnfABCDGE type electron transport complex subunit B [Desulfuromonadales bacterium]